MCVPVNCTPHNVCEMNTPLSVVHCQNTEASRDRIYTFMRDIIHQATFGTKQTLALLVACEGVWENDLDSNKCIR